MRRTILVVDDQKVNQKILGKILDNNYQVLFAENGAVALEVLDKNRGEVSAILLDLVMPVMNGYEFLTEIKKDSELVKIPIVVATQNNTEEIEVKALEMGASDFVTKPYNPKVILHRLANLIRMRESIANLADAEKDVLTGLYNRRAFYRRSGLYLKSNPQIEYQLVVLNVEKFKLFNDAHGWEEGDHFLLNLAETIKSVFHEWNAIIAHGDADVFFVMVEKSCDIAKMVKDIEERQQVLYPKHKVSLKYGIYYVTDINKKVGYMCDLAMLAVNSIKGQYDKKFSVYDEELSESIIVEQKITDIMQEALEQKQFQVYFQPKYDIETNKMVGAEALVRWVHPTLGFMSPAEFIPIFEKNGFVTEVDSFVWERVCYMLNKWKRTIGKTIPVSINVSRKDIYREGLVELLNELVKKYDLPPRMLHLEVTETAYTENTDQLIQVVSKLKENGFIIEMDDFGSGYSSLNLLAELPIDIIKLDMKFIQTESKYKNGHSIIASVINLAKWMNLLVIAEGVETQEQIDSLRSMNCNFVQGYYYAKPMPEEEFEKHLIEEDITPIYDMDDYLYRTVHRQKIDNTDDKELVLIVDDLTMNRAILTEYLKEDYQIVEAENGQVAWEYIKDNYQNIAAIILDIFMPVMNGYELLEKVKENHNYDDIIVIMTSADTETNNVDEMKDKGADGFIPKPYEKEEIVQKIKGALELQKRNMLRKLREAESRAKLDHMTGLYNRQEFENQIMSFFREDESGRATFILLDIDNFKIINDTMGHAVGDAAIRKVGEILKDCFRDNDLICRFGGDEFAAFIKTELRSHGLKMRMERLREKLRFTLDELEVSCSMGVCQCPNYGRDYTSLYHNADLALMSAKRLGRNKYYIFGNDFDLQLYTISRNVDWLLDEASDAIFICEEETNELLYLNDVAAQKLAKKSKRDCIGKPCFKTIWGLDTVCEDCTRISGGLSYGEHIVRLKDSNEVYYVKEKLIDWGGKKASIHFVQNRTEREKNIKYIKYQREIIERILKEQSILYWEYDIKEEKCINSSQIVNMCGFPEVIENFPQGAVDLGIVPEGYVEMITELHNRLKKNKQEEIIEGEICLKDGKIIKANISYMPLCNVDGECEKILGIAKL